MFIRSTRQEIKSSIGEKNFFIVVDERTNACGRYIAHLMIGALQENNSTNAYIIASKQLDKTNNVTVSRFIQQSLSSFFLPNPVPEKKFLVLLYDAAPYVVKVGQNLKVFYPNMVQVTCLLHGINRVAEIIRTEFPLVNKLISNIKKVLIKAPLREQMYRERLSGVSLPPEPVIIRWGTWIKAAIFYAEHFDAVKDLILDLEDDAQSVVQTTKEARCKTPDSPEGARQAPHSPNQSTPSVNGSPSPVNGGTNDSQTPPLPASTALSVSLEGIHPQHIPLGSSSSSITRPLVKVKRFLSTLVQFGNDIGADIGERVRSLVLNLVSSNLSIEEFHHSLQDVTNFPLRPFVLPFLRTHLPLLQREVHALARANKQSTLQYVRNHEHIVLDPAHSPSEISEIFMPTEMNFVGVKRRASESIYENGYGSHHHDEYPPIKRPMSQNPFYFPQQNLIVPNVPSSLNQSHILDYPPHTLTNKIDESNNRGEEEWKNIYVMLNCILSMVEKTKRALAILQQRNNQDLTNDWFRKQDVSVDLKKAANEIMMQAVKQTEDRVAEVKKRAEDAVNDVKRQAVIDLQKAVAIAEAKANELISVERAKMEKLISESRKLSEENQSSHLDTTDTSLSPPVLTQPAPSQQNACWNCGRKANETCSGCGIARYCGSFCQHKDWENHHQLCSKEKTAARTSIRATTPNAISTTNHVTPLESPPKFKK